MGTPTKKKKKRQLSTDTPPKAAVTTPPSSSTHTESGNTTNNPVSSRTPSTDMFSPFNSAYVTPLTTPTSIPVEFKRPTTSIITHSNIVVTHQPSTSTLTTPTYTTVNTITTTVLIHTPPRTITSPMSIPSSPNTSTLQYKIPTSPKLTPIFPQTTTTPKPISSPAAHVKKKPKPNPDLSAIEVIPASNSESDVVPYGRVIRKKKKTKKNTVSEIASDSEVEPTITNTPANLSTTKTKPSPPTQKTNILSTPPSAPSKNIPPIYIYTNKYSVLIKHLTQSIKPNPIFKFNNQALVCQPITADTHKEITNTLKDNKIEFFTYNLQRLRPTKIAIKYIPTDIDNDDIETDLRLKNPPFLQISRIMISKGGRKVPSNILILTIPQASVDEYYNLTDLCSLKVNVSEYVRQDIPQCHGCQRFGHSSAMCNRAHRCVRCGEAHEGLPCSAASCKCANCGEEHSSSYRGCQTYLAARARFLSTPHPDAQNSQIPQTQPTQSRDPITPRPPTNPLPEKPKLIPAPIPTTNPWTKKTVTEPTTKLTKTKQTKQ